MTMKSSEIRQGFLTFFEERGHRIVRSSSLVPSGDTTLLFTNAGMNQFKDVFVGRETRDYRRAVSSQKCLRVSGKHNDLEQVGRTARHQTFFEMLGNFSFGDYFKKPAIEYGWELLTKVWGLPEDRLWATVFGGEEGLPADAEAERIWLDVIGVAPSRFRQYGAADNFWSMGDTGPCGPCSEIHWDHGPAIGCGRGECEPSCPCGRFVELWNLVFMQFDRGSDGSLANLPDPSIDTGMGLERITSVMQGVDSNYATDLFRPVIARVEEISEQTYGGSPEGDVSMQVIADHLRAVTFLASDGVVPSNDKRGYVMRRLLRRAILHGKRLGLSEPFLHGLTPSVGQTMGGAYPELIESADYISGVIRREEEQFARTLTTGVGMLEESISRARESGESRIPGAELFRLYDTFGLPLDLARDLAEQSGLGVDEVGFEREMEQQRERARRSWTGGAEPASDAAITILQGAGESCFVGYGGLVSEEARIIGILRQGEPADRLNQGEEGEIVLDATPFYAEGGGQVGDAGIVAGPHGTARVTDTQSPVRGAIFHRAEVREGSLAVGQTVRAEVDGRRRRATMRNHTATHLFHAALREILGTHVKQSGSLVAPDRLRFDFSHFQAIDDVTLTAIEDLVNEKILEDLPVEPGTMPLDEALRSGAMALFGEKYPDTVRVLRIGDFSFELCGGTHTSHTGEIGLFKILSERGISSGVRRVEALSGQGALRRFQEDAGLVQTVESILNVPRPEIVEGLNRRLATGRSLQKEIERLRLKLAHGGGDGADERVIEVGAHKVVTRRADGLSGAEARTLADTLKQRIGSGVVLLGRADEGKASLLVSVTEDLAGRVNAGDLVRRLAPLVGGRGGGRADLAEAGGKDPSGLDPALEKGAESVRSLLAGEKSPA